MAAVLTSCSLSVAAHYDMSVSSFFAFIIICISKTSGIIYQRSLKLDLDHSVRADQLARRNPRK